MNMDETTTFGFSIDLPVRNEWRNVDLMRTSVQSCFSAVFKEFDGCHTLSMVTGELLENAMKYGDWSRGIQVFRLRITGNASTATVIVESPANPDSESVRELFETIAWIGTFDDAGDAYRARLLDIAGRDGDSEESGLGLVRIAYEGNSTLSADTIENAVRVTAVVDLTDE